MVTDDFSATECDAITCLNPYCNGRWSLTDKVETSVSDDMDSLNPYCNGRWSLTI